MKTIIYVLQDLNGDIRYVGKTHTSIEDRFASHISESRHNDKTYKCRWIRKCLINGYLPLIRIIDGPIEGDGSLEECYWISRLKREGAELTNSTIGGEGAPMTEESKAKLRAINLGKKLSNDHKHRISLAHKGKKLSDDHRRKLSISHIGHKQSQETILKRAAKLKGHTSGMLGKHHSKATLEKMSRMRLGIHYTQESIAKSAKARTGVKRSEETRQKMKAARLRFLENNK